MSSDNKTVNAIAIMAVSSLRMLSPIGHNAFFCCSRYGITMHGINRINRNFISHTIACQTDINSAVTSMIRELLEIKSGNFLLTSPEFTNSDISLMIYYLCREND
jgi:hypothetical protein